MKYLYYSIYKKNLNLYNINKSFKMIYITIMKKKSINMYNFNATLDV